LLWKAIVSYLKRRLRLRGSMIEAARRVMEGS
jgi:hypothetical protein